MLRRRFLQVAGSSTALSLAGCLTESSDSAATTTASGTDNDSGTGGSKETTSASGNSIDNHPAAVGLEDQPRLGDLGKHVIVAFEDPSCPRCRAFERQTVPKIEQNLTSQGKAAFVARTYPVIYPWGKPAVQALEATFARDEAAFWSLFRHYFEKQGSFDSNNVLDRTASFLDSNTDLDGQAVATDAENKKYDDAVQADLRAGENAGAQATPTVFLFRDGEYVTKAAGSVSYSLIARALGKQ
jgi:protein-disulfide isomerase